MLYIGNELKRRMDLLNIDITTLSEKSFVDINDIQSILSNQVPFELIDNFDLNLICSVLHCKQEYFLDEATRNRDLLIGCKNRGTDNEASIKVKTKIQDFMNDFTFLQGLVVNK